MTTDNKTLAVDVLAVMDREAKLARHYRIENGAVKVAEEASADACAARAAVAELIETVDKHLFAIRQMDEAMNDGINVQGAVSAAIGTEEMLRAALSRVKGESA
ncbi:hypothetical protein PQS91_10375 [Stenotrophomonas geniculata]|uniref:hypothetical protein n=1 Tax=Stenotrophomonas geniculata TaxID=86188 RepID=UPI00234F0C04|nr:hypothetical protein [Stenotrophomonas geniculata]MDC7800252.1 hypothetical protein [Stenotrophomonas geniculata]